MKRALSIFLTCVFLLGPLPAAALAAEVDSGGLCPHHQEHSFEDCGYVDAVEGQPCGYVHDGDCGFVEVAEEIPCDMDCNGTGEDDQIIHGGGCGYVLEVEGVPCQHEHDDKCGYVPADLGQPCGYVCPICPVEAGNGLPMPAAESDVTYLDCDSNGQRWEIKTCDSAIVAENNAGNVDWGVSDGKEYWYVVENTVQIRYITISGDVRVILKDRAQLDVPAGVYVGENNSLTIYAQSTGSNMGKLTAQSSNTSLAGIGGWRNCGTIIINGGTITATGGSYAAGIGGGYGGSGGEITISGGNVTAEGITGAGIGGGSGKDGGTIVIRGEATHVDARSTLGAGIGGGRESSVSGAGGNITIEGGTVIATGGQSSAGIGGAGGLIGGGGDHPAGNGGTITITGGKVTATGNNAPDIGGGKGKGDIIAPTDKIEIGPDADVKNGSGGEPNYGPAHGEDTSKWDSDDSQHWHPCGISGCPDTSHQSKKEAHSFGDWVTDEYDHWKECEICKRRKDEARHIYDLETVKPEALKSEADCETPATYYKSCVCGKVSTNDNETFTSGSALTHNMTHHAAAAATCTQTGNKEY